MLVAADAMVAGVAGAQRQRVVIVEHALQRGRGLEVDDADVALAALDARCLAHRRARIDAEGGGQAIRPVVRVGQLGVAASFRLLFGERADSRWALDRKSTRLNSSH